MVKLKLKIVCACLGWYCLLNNFFFGVYCLYALTEINQGSYFDRGVLGLIHYSALILSAILHFIASILVVNTTKTNNRNLLLPWIIITVLISIWLVVAAIIWQFVYDLIALPFFIVSLIIVIMYYYELGDISYSGMV